MMGIKHADRVTNDKIYKCTQQMPLREKNLYEIYGFYEPENELGKTKRGRPAESYANYIVEQISKP